MNFIAPKKDEVKVVSGSSRYASLRVYEYRRCPTLFVGNSPIFIGLGVAAILVPWLWLSIALGICAVLCGGATLLESIDRTGDVLIRSKWRFKQDGHSMMSSNRENYSHPQYQNAIKDFCADGNRDINDDYWYNQFDELNKATNALNKKNAKKAVESKINYAEFVRAELEMP